MLWNKVLNNKPPAPSGPVTYVTGRALPNQTSDATRTLSLSGFLPGDMIVAMTGRRLATSPTLIAGYTNICSFGASGGRSGRVQYKIATTTSENVVWTGAYGYAMVFRNASSIGAVNTRNTTSTAASIVVNLPDLGGLNTEGVNYVLAGSYLSELYTSASSPYFIASLQTSTLGVDIQALAAIDNGTSSALVGKNTLSSGSLYNTSYAVEILP